MKQKKIMKRRNIKHKQYRKEEKKTHKHEERK